MKSYFQAIGGIFFVSLMLVFASFPAQAATYNFSQDYAQGVRITGTFEGVDDGSGTGDRANDGILGFDADGSQREIRAFSFNVSGNAVADVDFSNGFLVTATLTLAKNTSAPTDRNLLSVDISGNGWGLILSSSGLLSIDGSNPRLINSVGDLIVTAAPVAQTPIPAAIFMFLPGLLGLLKFRRKI